MRVVRLGLTPVKGMEHVSRPLLELTAGGILDDRAFCLLDPGSGQVVRTVRHTALMACRADWRPPVLTVSTPLGTVTGTADDGATLTGDYWGREVDLVAVEGEWSALLSRYVGREVQLCRTLRPGAVIWGGAVSLVTTSSLAELARRTGVANDDGARFRPTLVVDTGSAPPFVEDTWLGARLRIGSVEITVRDSLPRCALVDRSPGAGTRDHHVLAALAADRTRAGEIVFGVHGDVVRPGQIALGDDVVINRDLLSSGR